MNTFSTLLDNPQARPPEDIQAEARNRFSELLSVTRLRERQPGSGIGPGTFIVLGVATWSPRDLLLLDEIHDNAERWSRHGVTIEVFDVQHCRSHQDFEQYIPGLNEPVYQTPVIAVWIDQVLVAIATGESATRLALKQHDVFRA